jgi:pilus assembly protein Flp/PilA
VWAIAQRIVAAIRATNGEEGQALMEYALILALVALVTIGVLQTLGANVSGTLGKVSSSMANVLNS